MMVTARQANKSTAMANVRQATKLTMMASADNDNEDGVTMVTTMAKATACWATSRMTTMTMTTVQQDVTTRTMLNDVNGRWTQ